MNVPETLDAIGTCKWQELVGTVDATQPGTADALVAYCVAWSQWITAQEKVQELGPVIKSAAGFAIVSPYVQVAAQAERRMRQWAAELQITPKARCKAKVEQPSAVSLILKQMDTDADTKPKKRKTA